MACRQRASVLAFHTCLDLLLLPQTTDSPDPTLSTSVGSKCDLCQHKHSTCRTVSLQIGAERMPAGCQWTLTTQELGSPHLQLRPRMWLEVSLEPTCVPVWCLSGSGGTQDEVLLLVDVSTDHQVQHLLSGSLEVQRTQADCLELCKLELFWSHDSGFKNQSLAL